MMFSINGAACSQFARSVLTFGKPSVDVQRERHDLFGSESARQFPEPVIRRVQRGKTARMVAGAG